MNYIKSFKAINYLKFWSFLISSDSYTIAISSRLIIKPILIMWLKVFLLMFLPKYLFYMILPVFIIVLFEIFFYSFIWIKYGYSRVIYFITSFIYILINLLLVQPFALNFYNNL